MAEQAMIIERAMNNAIVSMDMEGFVVTDEQCAYEKSSEERFETTDIEVKILKKKIELDYADDNFIEMHSANVKFTIGAFIKKTGECVGICRIGNAADWAWYCEELGDKDCFISDVQVCKQKLRKNVATYLVQGAMKIASNYYDRMFLDVSYWGEDDFDPSYLYYKVGFKDSTKELLDFFDMYADLKTMKGN